MAQLPLPWSASDRTSFAFESTVKRWPTILTSVIDHLNQLMHPLRPDNEQDSLRIAEAKSLISRIGELKYDISHDRKLKPIPPDDEINLALYNDELKKLEESGKDSWFTGPWLFNEAYIYRIVRSFFTQTLSWKDHDPFAKQKISTLRSSASSVYKLASSLQELVAKSIPTSSPTDIKAAFLTLAHASLWGNATDLSLLTNLTHAQIQQLQETREDEHEKILQNDISAAWDYIQTLENATIDLILDNAGFELYTDLIWMDWLVSCTPYVATVIIHPKTIPWFVSDVVPEDFTGLLDSLQDPDFFADGDKSSRDVLNAIVPRWRDHITTGKWKLSVPFDLPLGQDVSLDDEKQIPASWWTNPLPYWDIANRSKNDANSRKLYDHLCKSDLTIWKGDLNYRRLTGDLCWDSTTPFSTAVGALAGKFPILALRTCKADVVVALPPGKAEMLDQKDPRWRVSGHYAVVPFLPRM